MINKALFFIGGLIGITLSLLFRDGEWISFQEEVKSVIFWQIRLPRLLVSLIAGSSLSIAGLFFQSIFRNDLASPYTLGVASGASFGASVILWLGLSIPLQVGIFHFDTISIGAFIGALICVFLILGLAKLRRDQSPHFLILSGVMLSFMFSSGIMLVQYLAREMNLRKMVYWLMGDLNIVGMESIYLLLPISVGVIFYCYQKREVINILSMGDHFARSKGVVPTKERKRLFISLSLLVSFLVSLCGPIGFVGLMIPHIAKKRFGANLKDSFFPSLFGGAFFLVWCEFFSRILLSDIALPIGVVTSFIGGGFFLYLLIKKS